MVLTPMDIEIVPFDPKKATREQWAAFHKYRRIRQKEREPEDPVLDDETIETFMRNPDPQSEETYFVAVDPERPETQVGFLSFEVFREDAPSYETNKHLAWVGMSVLASQRRRGIGTKLLAAAAALTRERDRSTIVGYSDEPHGIAFIKATGGMVAQRARQSRLNLDDVDWDMVQEWADAGPNRSPDTSLEWVEGDMTGKLMEEYCELFTEVFNEMPFDDLDVGEFSFTPETVSQALGDWKEAGGVWFGGFAREADGKLSGLTEMGYLSDEEEIIRQFMTGVGKVYRGRGLGKWLKAAMLLKVREEFPQVRVVATGNATSNAPMLTINERLGFKPHREGIAGQIALDALEDYLAG